MLWHLAAGASVPRTTLLFSNVAQMGFNQAMGLKLRETATLDLIRNWMSDKRASRIIRVGEIGRNPDQRIHEDTRHLTELTTDLGIRFLKSSLLLVSFIGVLWVYPEGLIFHFGNVRFNIPGHMVWAALLYATTGSLLRGALEGRSFGLTPIVTQKRLT